MYQLDFTSELMERKYSDNCKKACLCAIVKHAGFLAKSGSHLRLEIVHEKTTPLYYTAMLLRELFKVEVSVGLTDGNRLGQKAYVLIVPALKTKEILSELKLAIYDKNGSIITTEESIPDEFSRGDAFSAYVAGISIMAGKLFVPETEAENKSAGGGYRLELVSVNGMVADSLLKHCDEIGIKLRFSEKREEGLVYSTDSTAICDFMALIGANEVNLKLQDTLIERSIRNDVNRKNNCSYANMDRAISAAAKAIEAIELLKKRGKYEALDSKLKETAQMRVQNMEMSLDELAVALNVSKSCVNHRLRKLVALAAE